MIYESIGCNVYIIKLSDYFELSFDNTNKGKFSFNNIYIITTNKNVAPQHSKITKLLNPFISDPTLTTTNEHRNKQMK